MKQISSLLTAVALLLLCGGCVSATKIKTEQEDAKAQFRLGAMYYWGADVPTDDVEAAKWIRKEAEQWLASAQSNLGFKYYNGAGVPEDYVEAAKWYRKAAEQGHFYAQRNLGFMYDEGQGVPKDYVEAYAWFLLLKANRDELSNEKISNYEKVFTLEQREKGQARAAELQRLIEQKSAE